MEEQTVLDGSDTMNAWNNAVTNKTTTRGAGASGKADALFRKARKYHRNGNYPESLRHYKLALNIDRGNSRIWLNMALVYSSMGRSEDALRAYFIACKLDPSLYGKRADAHAIKEVEENVKQTLNHGVTPHRYKVLLRDYEAMLGIQDKALPIITKIFREIDGELVPEDIETELPETPAEADDLIAIELGNIQNIEEPWSDQFDAVIGHYRKIFRTIEQRPQIPYYYQSGEHEGWLKSVKQEIDENLDIYEEQLPHFEKETKQGIISEVALNLSRILDFERAIDVCQRSYSINPHYPKTRMIHAHCNAYIGRFEEAKEQYERALDQSKEMDERCEILELKGVAHFRLNEKEEAIESFRTARRIAQKLKRSGKISDAKECYERSLKNVENLAFMSEIMYLKGQAHLREGEKEQAEECLERANDMAHSKSLKKMSAQDIRKLSLGII